MVEENYVVSWRKRCRGLTIPGDCDEPLPPHLRGEKMKELYFNYMRLEEWKQQASDVDERKARAEIALVFGKMWLTAASANRKRLAGVLTKKDQATQTSPETESPQTSPSRRWCTIS